MEQNLHQQNNMETLEKIVLTLVIVGLITIFTLMIISFSWTRN